MIDPMDLTEKTIRREDKFQGRILSVHVDTVLLPNGNTSTREVVDHVDGADRDAVPLCIRQDSA